MTETFVLYLYGSDGLHGGKTFYEGEKALVEAAAAAAATGDYHEIRGTDLLDRLVLHWENGVLVHPAGFPDLLDRVNGVKHGLLDKGSSGWDYDES
jgi:hypothetical protein